MNLYHISLQKESNTITLLRQSCEKLGVGYILLDPASTHPFEVGIQPGDAVYRNADAYNIGVVGLEHQLVTPSTATFYKNNNSLLINAEESDSYILANKGIATPKTANYIPQERAIQKSVVEQLGGFPLIIKSLGGSHGVGVVRVDSFQSFYSVTDLLHAKGGRYVLKEYIESNHSARLIVLEGKVIDSIEYQANEGDFRSNEGAVPNVSVKEFNEETKKLAIRAVDVLGLEFGGVDIVFTKEEKPLVVEVNFPCYFPRCQLLSGTDISGMMVAFLKKKSEEILAKR